MNYVPPRRSDGTIQTQRVQQPWPKDKPLRILSMDGGGICGILPASVLAELEHRFLEGKSIGPCFDMVGGTPTGGIIALGLGCGMTSAQIRDVYVQRGEAIFRRGNRLVQMLRKLRRVVRYKHDAKVLEGELIVFRGTG